MNREAYEDVLHQAHAVRLAARALAGAELDEAIDMCVRAETTGPILDPTAWRDRGEAMREDEATMRAVRVLARLGEPDPVAFTGAAGAGRKGPAAS